jgi:TonB family protein
MSRIHLSAAVLLAATGLSTVASAQLPVTGTVSGEIRDVQKRPIPNATVLLVDAGTGTLSSPDGKYTLLTAPGQVKLLVQARGYKPFMLTGLRVIANTTVQQDFTLADSLPGRIATVMREQFTVDQVDDPVAYVGGPSPKYPDSLKAAKVSGSVTMRFVVGTDGRAESSSVQVLNSTNRAFEDPAIEAIKGSTFRPARIKDTPVRQLVEQVVRFTPASQ